jgi:hypothetical protein
MRSKGSISICISPKIGHAAKKEKLKETGEQKNN